MNLRNDFLLVILLLISAAGCTEQEEPVNLEQLPSVVNMPSANLSISGKTFSYLALGDSYTIGQGVDENLNWPNQLKSQMLGKTVRLNPVNIIAKTGWTTSALLEAIDQQKPGKHDLVSLMIGVNNQFQNIPIAQFKTEFEKLLDIAIDLAGTEQGVFVVSIPDYSVTKFGGSNSPQIAREIDSYNRHIEERCLARKIQFIDVTAISRSLGDAQNALADDGLHPSRSQYSVWVNSMLSDIIYLLENQSD